MQEALSQLNLMRTWNWFQAKIKIAFLLINNTLKTNHGQPTNVFRDNGAASKHGKYEDERPAGQHDVDGSGVKVVADNDSQEVPVNRHPYSNTEKNAAQHLKKLTANWKLIH